MRIWESVKKLVSRKNFGSKENLPKAECSSIRWYFDSQGNLIPPLKQDPIFLTAGGLQSGRSDPSIIVPKGGTGEVYPKEEVAHIVKKYLDNGKELQLLTRVFRCIREYKEENKCDY